MLYNSNQIQEIIPHRYPFLLVDAIKEISDDRKTIIGIKNVSANEMQFMGHFPDKHVMPGVLIVEALAQTGCVLLLEQECNRGKIAYFAGINKLRFKRQVIPSETIELKVSFTKSRSNIYFADVEASVNGESAVHGEIMCAVAD